jgi:hypothetical protein
MALGASAQAQTQAENFAQRFPRMSWTEKVAAMQSAGADYHHDCTGAAKSGTCLEIMIFFVGEFGFVETRESTDGTAHDWCVGNHQDRTMTCYDQVTGSPTRFVLLGHEWHSVN